MGKSIYTQEHIRTIAQLKKARELLKLRQAEVAEKLGRTQSYISKIESGQRRINISQLREFARIYKKSITFFLR